MTIQITDKSPKTYIVLGMHQGGTSIISKALHDQGVDMGAADESVYERIPFVRMNETLLTIAGGSWMYPPPIQRIKDAGKHREGDIKALLQKNKRDFWGFKDPRSGATIHAYLPYLEDDTYLVCIFRKPEKVAESIQRKGHTNKEHALKIAKEYYARILDAVKEFTGI